MCFAPLVTGPDFPSAIVWAAVLSQNICAGTQISKVIQAPPTLTEMSSFMKKNPRLSVILKADESSATAKTVPSGTPGLTPSLTGASSLLASSGIPDLDVCLGGGLPPGTLLSVFEDFPASRANYTWTAIVRCFLAEGVVTAALDWTRRDGGWVAIVGHDITGVLSNLPKPELSSSSSSSSTKTELESLSKNTATEESMKIAWRYEGMKEFDSKLKRPNSTLSSGNEKTLGHTFDLGRKNDSIPKQLVESNRALEFDLSKVRNSCDYQRTWEFLKDALHQNQRSGMGRIVIGSLGAPGLWNCSCPKSSSSSSSSPCGPAWLARILSNHIQETDAAHPCLALITLPTAYLVEKLVIPGLSRSNESTLLPPWVTAVENVSDAVIELRPLAGLTLKSSRTRNSAENQLTREYDGFLFIRKYLRRPNSFKQFIPETANLAFKIKRRRFGIEKFHLPPSIESDPLQSGSCTSSKAPVTSSPLDF